MANPVLEPHPFSSMLRKEVLGGAYVPFRRKDSLDPVTWEYFSSSFSVCFLFLLLTLQVGEVDGELGSGNVGSLQWGSLAG